MAPLYMGRGGLDSVMGGNYWGKNPITTPATWSPISNPSPIRPVGPEPGKEIPHLGSPAAATPPNVLPAQTVRATGPSQGFDPSYLQNLATSIGGLFSRPKGNLSFNPLGNLSEISPASGQFGNAPGFGEPSTWLQDALNGIAFMFKPPTPPVVRPPQPVNNQFGEGRGRYGGPNVE